MSGRRIIITDEELMPDGVEETAGIYMLDNRIKSTWRNAGLRPQPIGVVNCESCMVDGGWWMASCLSETKGVSKISCH